MATVNVEVKLNKQEEEMIAKLPEALRAQVTQSILSAKREAMTSLITNRTAFSWTINELGTIVIRGLGNRFPTGMRYDSLEVLLSHVDELKKAVDAAKEYIAENADKVEAAVAKRNTKRRNDAKVLSLLNKAVQPKQA